MKKFIFSTRGILSIIVILSFLFIFILALIFTSYVRHINQNAINSFETAADGYISEVQANINNYTTAMEMIFLNQTMRDNIYRTDATRQEMVSLGKTLDNIIVSITFFLDQYEKVVRHVMYTYLPTDGGHFFNVEAAEQQPWFSDMDNNKFHTYYSYSNLTKSIQLSLISKNDKFGTELPVYQTCYQVITIDMAQHFTPPKNLMSIKKTDLAIFNNEDGALLHCTNSEYSNQASEWYINRQDKIFTGDIIPVAREIDKLGLTFLLLYTPSPLIRMGNYGEYILIGFIAVIYFALIIFVLHFYRNYSGQLNQLVQRMDSFDEKKPVEYHMDFYTTEIAYISHHLYEMQNRIYMLIQKEYLARIELINARQEALIACINPHFLYNTLTSISAMANMEGAEKSVEMLQELSDMFRYAADISKRYVILEEEVQNTKHYLYIQNIRFQGDFTCNINIESETLKIEVPKLILQPIVENVFKHGFSGEKKKSGIQKELSIHSFIKNDDMYISVRDNGVGLTKESCIQLEESLNSKELVSPDNKTARIGLVNVHNRLQLTYGDGYGISIESEKGCFTEIQLKIGKIHA